MTVYQPDPESLAAHPMPDWWRDAKLGVMTTWGLYSVPAWAPRGVDVIELLANRPDDALKLTPYAEWYENSVKFPDGPTAAQHRERFGNRPYAAFREDFERAIAAWSADALLDFVAEIGARYMVPVTKHHDSYCLWPTAFVNPLRGAGWHAPRHLVREMADAARQRGIAFGVYYSAGLDWTLNPEPIANLGEMRASLPRGEVACAMMDTHFRELIRDIDPDILWNDIGYPDADDFHRLIADYYNARPDGVINDRFQLPTPEHAEMADPDKRAAFNRSVADALNTPGFAFAPDVPPVFDHRTPEYATSSQMGDTPWETVRGVGHSFGYKANETADDFLTGEELIDMFLGVVGHGGNLLINIGPRADGSIPAEQARPLRALGAFLKSCGEGIYGTRKSALLPPVPLAEGELLPVSRGREHFALATTSPAAGAVRLGGWAAVDALADLDGRQLPAERNGDDLSVTFPDGAPRVFRILMR